LTAAVVIGIVVFVLVAVFLVPQLVDVYQTIRVVFSKPITGAEAMQGKRVVTRTELEPEGTVFLDGELWKAVSLEGNIEAGVTVIINRIEGLTLFVIRKV